MKLYFGRGNRRLIIDTQGAVIESYREEDKEIFFDRRQMKSGKIRGGSHVCYPNFGIDTVVGLPAHGFARDVAWEVVMRDDFSVILKVDGEKPYDTVQVYLVYELLEDGLKMGLTVTNRGKDVLAFAPAFHPYFFSKQQMVSVNGKDMTNEALEKTVFLATDEVEFTTSERSFRLTGKNIHHFAVWTDYEGDYVCIEPTYSKAAFRPGLKNCKKLEVGQTFHFDAYLTVL